MHLPIGEFLYSLKSALDNKMESLAERDQKVKRDQANCHYVGPKSQKLLGRIKERGFKQVFDSLDEDKVFHCNPALYLTAFSSDTADHNFYTSSALLSRHLIFYRVACLASPGWFCTVGNCQFAAVM